MPKPVKFSTAPKPAPKPRPTPTADTSFDFGANVAKPRKSKGKPGGGS